MFLKLTDSYLFIPSHFKCVYTLWPAPSPSAPQLEYSRLSQETLSQTNRGWENMLSHSLTQTKRNAKKECFPIARLPAPPVPVSPTPCERFYP